jgi:hypothetical protein
MQLPGGTEFLVGPRNSDCAVGATALAGAGGTAEVLSDTLTALVPLTENSARETRSRLYIRLLLTGCPRVIRPHISPGARFFARTSHLLREQ